MKSSRSRSRSKSSRNRNSGGGGGNVVNRVFDSSGPEGKVRGTPQQIIDKYNQLARDAQLANDRVATENFQQHAEHYLRMLSEAQREMEARREEQERQNRERQAERDRERNERQEREQQQQQAQTPPPADDPGAAPQPDVLEVADAAPAEAGDSGLVETPESAPKKLPRKPRARKAPAKTTPPKKTPAKTAPTKKTPAKNASEPIGGALARAAAADGRACWRPGPTPLARRLRLLRRRRPRRRPRRLSRHRPHCRRRRRKFPRSHRCTNRLQWNRSPSRSSAQVLTPVIETDRKSTRLNSSHVKRYRMPSSA